MANQKDYKAISEIIRGLVDIGKFSPVWMCNNPKELIRQLADYFEREDKCLTCNGKGGHYYQRTPDTNEDAEMCNDCDGKGIKEFNRQQFLKDCGVEK